MKPNTTKTYVAIRLLSILPIFLLCTELDAQTSGSQSQQESMRLSLYQLNSNGSTVLADGNLTNYDDSFSNGLEDDAPKMNNFGENFGIERFGTKLAIEQRKKITVSDTAFFSMWNMQQRNYRMQIINCNLNHPGLLGFWEDSYLNTSTPLILNGSNEVDFTINSDPASYAHNRFKITFRNPVLIPLSASFTMLSGNMNYKTDEIELHCSISNENSFREIQLEKSANGSTFTVIQNLSASTSTGITNHDFYDPHYFNGMNHYRVKAITLNGAFHYSELINIKVARLTDEITVFPNPVSHNYFHIRISSKQKGRCKMSLIDANGNKIDLPGIDIAEGTEERVVKLPDYVKKGSYNAMVMLPDNKIKVLKIIVL